MGNSDEGTDKPIKVDVLRSKIVMIQAIPRLGADNGYAQLYALCEDGSVWMKTIIGGAFNPMLNGGWECVTQSGTGG